MSYAKIRPARGNNTEWNTTDPILLEGELGIEYPDSGIGTGLCKFKLGDGHSKWSELAYAFDASNASSIIGGGVSSAHNLISFRSGTLDEWESTNPILEIGEPGFCITNCRIKIGDGEHSWNELPYADGRDEQLANQYNFGRQLIDGTLVYEDDEAFGDYDFGDFDGL